MIAAQDIEIKLESKRELEDALDIIISKVGSSSPIKVTISHSESVGGIEKSHSVTVERGVRA